LFACGGSNSTTTESSKQYGRYSSQYDSAPRQFVDVNNIPNAVPKYSPRSRSGNPKSYAVFGRRYTVMKSGVGYKKRGIASWYGRKFHGHRTSSGEPYDMHAMTAAHKTLPLPSYVKVTNLKNGRQVIVKINDRGPFHENRIIDLSHTAAVKLGIKATGTGFVEVETISPSQHQIQNHKNKSAKKIILSNKKVHLYLQLGAFISLKNAQQLTQKVNLALNSISTEKAQVSTLLNHQKKFYRVRLGPLKNPQQADNLILTLNQKGFKQHRIIIE
jgi:rare lipoprotein A